MEDAYVADGSRNADLKQAIIDCSLEAGELSRMTAFVAVDETERVTDGADPHRITQPVEMPEGWQWNVCPLDRSLLIQMPGSGAAAELLSKEIMRSELPADSILHELADTTIDFAESTRDFMACEAPKAAGSGMELNAFSIQPWWMQRREPLDAADEIDALMDSNADYSDDLNRKRGTPGGRTRKSGFTFGAAPETPAEAPAIRLVNLLFAEAIRVRATNLTIVSQQEKIEIRIVIDGVVHERDPLPKQLLAAIIAHLKLLGKLDVTVCDRLQSGHVEITVENKPVRLLVHFAPQEFGEAILNDFSIASTDAEHPEAVRNWWAANRLAEI